MDDANFLNYLERCIELHSEENNIVGWDNLKNTRMVEQTHVNFAG